MRSMDGTSGSIRTLLCLGAHADDMEIGAGGTVSQLLAANPRGFTRDTFNALMRLRGVECNSASGYAEAFHGYKLVFNPVQGAMK